MTGRTGEEGGGGLMVVDEVESWRLLKLVEEFHYSMVMPVHTKHYLGCFDGGVLVGGLTLGWGTQPKHTIRKVLPCLTTADYFEIGKMVMDDRLPRNSESKMLAGVIRWIKESLPHIQYLYTWADGIVGKPGYVYQAANFLYGGFIWTDIYIGPDGEKIHPRTAKKLCQENAAEEGKEKVFWLTRSFCQSRGIKRIRGKQFRYIYPLSRAAKKGLEASPLTWSRKYPKHEDLEWRVQMAEGGYGPFCGPPKFKKDVRGLNKKNLNKNYGCGAGIALQRTLL
jgi:hypothetical protein